MTLTGEMTACCRHGQAAHAFERTAMTPTIIHPHTWGDRSPACAAMTGSPGQARQAACLPKGRAAMPRIAGHDYSVLEMGIALWIRFSKAHLPHGSQYPIRIDRASAASLTRIAPRPSPQGKVMHTRQASMPDVPASSHASTRIPSTGPRSTCPCAAHAWT
jgi:hypothetical protein